MELSTFGWITVFAVASALVNALGILAVMRHTEKAKGLKDYFMCFAAGVLITTPLLLAFPNALNSNSNAGFLALSGFLFMLFSNRAIEYLTQEETVAFGVTAAQGIGIHSLVDGVIYTVTFKVSLITGLLAGTGLVVHEFAEGVITYTVLMKGGVEKKMAGFYAFLTASLTTPLGAFLAFPLVNDLPKTSLGLLMGFVSGVLIYISAAHLLPEAMDHEDGHSVIALLLGVGLALIIVFTKGA